MVQTSTVRYDRDHPHEMKMVWDEWLKHKDHLIESTKNDVYDNWLTGKVQLAICQKVWNRIVATYL